MKVIFLPNNEFSFAFCTFISVICYFIFHHQTISSWFKKLYPGMMSHLNGRSKIGKSSWNKTLLTDFMHFEFRKNGDPYSSFTWLFWRWESIAWCVLVSCWSTWTNGLCWTISCLYSPRSPPASPLYWWAFWVSTN